MRQIKDVLRLTLVLHHSQRHIAASLGISKGVVAKYIKLASDGGLHWPQIEAMSETDVHNRLLGTAARASSFVAALGASGYTFAYATPRETMGDWLGATAQALRFYGGCTELIVPDNPKALIANPDRYEPRANDTVLDFARHYNTSVLPARPRRPQDKAKAESAVQVVERWILMRLRHHRFETVDEAAIAPLLHQLNNKLFQKLPGSRASVFAQIDAPALRALPMQAWELAEFKTVKVHIDSHVQFDEHYYSVPHALVGQSMEVRATQRCPLICSSLCQGSPSTKASNCCFVKVTGAVLCASACGQTKHPTSVSLRDAHHTPNPSCTSSLMRVARALANR
jgi:transposase